MTLKYKIHYQFYDDKFETIIDRTFPAEIDKDYDDCTPNEIKSAIEKSFLEMLDNCFWWEQVW